MNNYKPSNIKVINLDNKDPCSPIICPSIDIKDRFPLVLLEIKKNSPLGVEIKAMVKEIQRVYIDWIRGLPNVNN